MELNLLNEVIPFKWRVQSAIPKAAPTHVQMIAYVDARDVALQLDRVVGVANWCDKYEEVKGHLFCSIGIKIQGEWVFKSDVGTESKTEKEKGESSDAFKRAAVKWGINREAYRVGLVKLPCKMYNNQPYPCDEKGVFLKGQKLYDHCNKLARVEDLENYDLETKIDDTYSQLVELWDLKKEFTPSNEVAGIEKVINGKISKEYNKVKNYLSKL